MKNFAIIVAAGNGERFCNSENKMFVPLFEKPLLSYTLDKFEESKIIDDIILVIRAQDRNFIEEKIIKKNKFSKVSVITIGGSSRQMSVYNGLKTITEEDGVVCIHDGARPLLRKWMIGKTIKMIETFDGVILGVPAVETVKMVNLYEMVVEKTVDREKIWIAQTPQTFRLRKIRKFYERAMKENIQVTDDSALLEYYGGEVAIVRGSEENIKITTKVDLLLAEVIMSNHLFNK